MIREEDITSELPHVAALLEELKATSQSAKDARSTLLTALARRDALIVEAVEAGATQAIVASAAGMTQPRIQQITARAAA